MSDTPSIVLITGANKGIGLETGRQLGRKGMHVFLGARNLARGKAAAEKLTAEGITAEAIELDVTNPATIRAAADAVAQRFGRLDILVNNAAVSLDVQTKKPTEQTLEMWRQTFETNFFGVIAVTQAFVPLLLKSKAGRIVNLSSGLASSTLHCDPKEGLPKNIAAYSVSKTAVNAWTIFLAHELKDTPIKVNAGDPGWVKTDLGGPDAPLEVDAGARTSVHLATLGPDGPTGGFYKTANSIPW
jgi:NAD(P)-dependent dehydrogenase (short-subunit alcohol dehydrogenase family)